MLTYFMKKYISLGHMTPTDNVIPSSAQYYNKHAITADITKMFRQINVHKKDRKYQMILCRENSRQIRNIRIEYSHVWDDVIFLKLCILLGPMLSVQTFMCMIFCQVLILSRF